MKKSLSILSISLGLFACGDGHAEEQKAHSGLMTAEQICRLAWEQNEEQLQPEDRLGNPYLMLKTPEASWHFEMDYAGRKLFVRPARSLAYQVELDDQTLDCEVPVSWKVLDSTLDVHFDPQFKNKRQVTMIGGKPFGSETKGGLYIRHQLIPGDAQDINLAWFLKSPALKKADVIQAVREHLLIPVEQNIEIQQATDLLRNQGAMGIQAVGMSVGQAPLTHWAQLPAQAAQLWPQLKFLPLGEPTAAATVEQAWTQAGILDLATMKLWDVKQKRLADCASVGTANRPACRQIVDDTFYKVYQEAQNQTADLCVHLAWSGADFSPYMLSSYCIDPQGSVKSMGSQASLNPGFSAATTQGR